MKKRILSFLLALCMCLTLVPVTVLADDDIQQINDTAVQAITPGSDVSVLSVVKPDDAYYRTYEFYVDGEEINTQIVKNGDTLYEPPVTAPAGKTFTGWDNKDVHFGTISGITATETITVNAVFEDGYHVFFKESPDGRIIATKTVANGTKVTFEDVNFPVGSDEAITGWYEDAGLTKKVDSVTINGADITLYAKVEKGYWLTFESNGGSYVAPAFYATNTIAAAPTAPTKSGYAFVNWYTDASLTTAADFSAITASTTLYAKWAENGNTSYTVIHWLENADDDDYSYKESETKTGTTGGQTNATAKSYTGFTAQTITQEIIKGDGSTIVSVYYKRNVYEVKFYTKDSWRDDWKEDTSKRITAKYGANISDKWPGGGWYVSPPSMWSSTAQSNIDTMPLNGKNFYGQQSGDTTYKADYYTEVLPGQPGTTVGSHTYKLHHTDEIQAGWGLKVTDEERYPITGFTCNTAVSTKNGQSYNGAKFYYTRNSYDLVFISGGKTVKTAPVKYQASIADYANYKPDNAPAGMEDYVFDDWYASKECTGEAYDFTGKTMPANSITLYAKWVAPTFTVTVYDQNSIYLDEIIVSKGDTVTDELSKLEAQLKLTLDTGDSFLGWTINRGLHFNPGTKITTNYNLYAKVGNSTGYSVTYDATGGTGSVTDTEKYAKGAEATVKSNNGFTNGDKVFLSWNTAADGTGKTYYPNSTVEITGNVTLYAQWGDKASTVQLTYKANGGKEADIVRNNLLNNEPVTLLGAGTFTRTGYTLTGWNTQPDGNGKGFALGASARVDNLGSGNVLYAQWEANTDTAYKVEFYYQNDDGSYPSTASKTEPRTGTTDATVSVTDADKADKENGKYTFDANNANNILSGPVAADGSLVLKLYFKLNQFQLTINYVYADGTTAATSHSETLTVGEDYSVDSPEIEGYTPSKDTVSGKMPAENVVETVTYTKRTDLSYTVHYYWNGTTESVAQDKTVGNQTFNASVTESPVAVTGCTPVNEDSKAITIGTGKNEIIFYYYKNVELTANSKTETYDGTEKSVSGYTGAPADADFSAITVGAKGTEAGTYNANFAAGTVGKVDANKKYIVTKATPGKLTIKPAEVTVTIKGNTKTETYDGTEYTVTGYTIESISNDLYSADNVTLKDGAKVEAKGTNAGDYMMGLTAGSFANSNTNFEVTFVVEDGKLTIAKRDVTVTGESATKVYNGQTQEINGYTVDNLVKGHEMTGVIYSAKGKDPGKYDGSFTGRQIVIKDAAGTDVTANYNVKPVIGVLTITQPSHPTRPSTPTKDVTSVKTADGSQMTLWMSMMLASAAGIVFLGKKRKEEQ